MTLHKIFSYLLVAAASTVAPAMAAESSYPQKPVSIIVSLPPGSGADTTARFLSRHLSQELGQPFVVENKPGANSVIAARYVAEAQPDGYTLFVASNTPMVTNAATIKDLPYDPIKDFIPVASVGRFPMLIVVPASSPYQTLADLANALKNEPGKLNFAAGTPTYQIAMEIFHERVGARGTTVPYKGTGPAITDVAAGVADYSIAEISAVTSLIRAGKLRALGIAADERHKDLPDLSTIAEQGFPGYEAYAWTGVFFPAGVPQPIVQRVGDIVRATLADKEGIDFVENMGATVFTGSAEQFAEFQRSEIETMKRIVSEAGLAVQ